MVVKQLLQSFEACLQERLSDVVCNIECELDVSSAFVRTRECAIGNIAADAMRLALGTDCAVFNSGALRADLLYDPGVVTIKDVLDILPMEDSVASVRIRGEDLLCAMESAVEFYPAHEGRFPQVSGMTLVFDPSKAGGHRILKVFCI